MNKLIVALGSVMGLHGLVLASNEPTQPERIVPENESVKKLQETEIIEQIQEESRWRPPSFDEVKQMDPEACKKVLLELYTLRGPVGWFMNQQSPVQCELCSAFAEKMTNEEFGEKLADLFSLTHTAYRQADWNITVGFCHVATLGSRLELLHKEIQEAWEKEKQRQSELMDIVKRYSIQLLPPDQPPSTDKTPVSLLEEFNSLRNEYIQGMSAWYEKLVKCNEVVSQRFEEFFATYRKYAELKQMNDKNADQLKTVVHGLSKYFEGKTKPSEKAKNPKNLTD